MSLRFTRGNESVHLLWADHHLLLYTLQLHAQLFAFHDPHVGLSGGGAEQIIDLFVVNLQVRNSKEELPFVFNGIPDKMNKLQQHTPGRGAKRDKMQSQL